MFSSRGLATRPDQHFRRNPQLVVQSPNHADRELALAVQYLGDARTCAEDSLQIAPRQPLLLHAKLDRFDRIGRVNRTVLAFILQKSYVDGPRLRRRFGSALTVRSGAVIPF